MGVHVCEIDRHLATLSQGQPINLFLLNKREEVRLALGWDVIRVNARSLKPQPRSKPRVRCFFAAGGIPSPAPTAVSLNARYPLTYIVIIKGYKEQIVLLAPMFQSVHLFFPCSHHHLAYIVHGLQVNLVTLTLTC